MHCIEALARAAAGVALASIAGCSSSLQSPAPVSSAAAVAAAPVPAARPAIVPLAPAVLRKPPEAAVLPPARHARNWDEYRMNAALRLVAASKSHTYDGSVPEVLLAIPVLEVELNGDGSVRRINVLRRPSQAHDTVQLAIDAVHRAAPFGSVTHLPRPWKFNEVFLFNDHRRFKPRTLDL